jgi:hypothetical protein
MGAESGTRANLVKILCRLKLDAFAVENPARPGTPDVNYLHGWIEVKRTKKWPKRAETPVRLDHGLNQAQKVWIKRREKVGGTVYVFLHLDRDLLLFRGGDAVDHLGSANAAELRELAIFAVRGWKAVADELKSLLCPSLIQKPSEPS